MTTNTHELIEVLDDSAKEAIRFALTAYTCQNSRLMDCDLDDAVTDILDDLARAGFTVLPRQALAIQPQAEAQPGVAELVEALELIVQNCDATSAPFHVRVKYIAHLARNALDGKTFNYRSPVPGAATAEDAARLIDQKFKDYVEEFGRMEPDTGHMNFPGNGDEYLETLEELAEEIRLLKPSAALVVVEPSLTPAQPAGDVRELDLKAHEIFGLIGDHWSDHQFLELMTAEHPQLGMSVAAALMSGRADDVLQMLKRLDSGAYL
jgi:hypothetical protein